MHCEDLVDISPLALCTSLRTLNLNWCRQLVDVSPLAHITSLTFLDVSWCRSLPSIAPLTSCSLLTHVDLSYCSKVVDIAPLAACVSLVTLNVSDVKVDNGGVDSLKPLLTSCPALSRLSVSRLDALALDPTFAVCSALKQLAITTCAHLADIRHCPAARPSLRFTWAAASASPISAL